MAVKEIAPFLRSLRRLLTSEPASVVCWTADGTAFEIHDLAALVAQVLPKYFKHAKYSSFQRQLNYFHFRKWTRSKTAVCTFANPHFQRDAPDLERRITRKRPPAKAPLAIAVQARTPRRPKATSDGLASPTDATSTGLHVERESDRAWPLDGPDEMPPLDWIDALYASLDAGGGVNG